MCTASTPREVWARLTIDVQHVHGPAVASSIMMSVVRDGGLSSCNLRTILKAALSGAWVGVDISQTINL